MNTGTSRASARRKSVFISSTSGSRVPQRIGRFDQGRAERAAEHGLDLLRGGRDDRLLGLRADGVDHGFADDPDAHPWSAPGVPDACAWLAYGVLSTEERGTVV